MPRDPTSVLVRRFAPGALLVVAGLIVLAAAGGRTGLEGVAILLAGAGAIWLVSAAFFTVGRSEDLDRRRRPRG